jgi:hypothetical protein
MLVDFEVEVASMNEEGLQNVCEESQMVCYFFHSHLSLMLVVFFLIVFSGSKILSYLYTAPLAFIACVTLFLLDFFFFRGGVIACLSRVSLSPPFPAFSADYPFNTDLKRTT